MTGHPTMVEPARLADAVRDTARYGYVHLGSAFDDKWRRSLLRCATGGWHRLPTQIGPVRQVAEECVLDRAFPTPITAFAEATRLAVAASTGVAYRPTEATYMRYVGRTSGISPHRDHARYRVLVAIASLTGDAVLTIHGSRDDTDVLDSLLLHPGDLVLLRGVGLVSDLDHDARPLHAISAPSGVNRISLSLRMAPPSG